MLHQHRHYHVDQHELRHQDEHHEEEGREVGRDAAVPQTVVALLAFLPQSVLHDSVPVVAGRDPEEGEESHAEGAEVGVFAQTLARMVVVAF